MPCQHSLGHGCFLGEWPSLLLEPRSVVRQQACRLNLDGRLGKVVAHLLKVTNVLAELLSLVGVGDGVVERALGDTDHLGGDTDSAFVQDFDCDLSAMSWANLLCTPCQSRRQCSPWGF